MMPRSYWVAPSTAFQRTTTAVLLVADPGLVVEPGDIPLGVAGVEVGVEVALGVVPNDWIASSVARPRLAS